MVSGKVNQVSYQPGQPDAFYHRYVYDAENRITNVLTSADSVNWDNDAFYQYYDHGPLARTILGEQQVQGINYAYNLQGWMKAINPNVYDTTGYALKADGNTGTVVGKTAYNVMLNYFKGDYKAISGAAPQDALINATYRPLYNGNISSMAVNVAALNNPFLYNYQYDQLNRLVAMDAWKKTGTNWSNLDSLGDFQERISYDPNGNILGYKRNGNTAGGKPLGMDGLNYSYVMGTNRLDHVSDNVSATNYDVDIDNQSAGNYVYDSIGNLVKDNAEGITSISWTVYGKINRIVKGDSIDITYTYGPDGNRISKTVIKSGAADTARTWYVRDATGNVMSVYESGKPALHDGRLTQSELHLYGSSRVGLIRRSIDVVSPYNPADTVMPLLGTGLSVNFGRGDKLFELSNHLGNVLVTINDKKIGVSSGSSSLIDHYEPQVVSAQDYYPFGMLQPGRSYNAGGYRYGFNGKENDNEVKGNGEQQDYGMRVYDPRLGRFLSVDPLSKSYPWNSPYAYGEGDVIRSVDLDGLEKVIINTVSFAPFDYFGADTWGTYVGNGQNRKFGENITSTVVNGTKIENYKLRGEAALDLTTMTETSHKPVGAAAKYYPYIPGPFSMPLRGSKIRYSPASFQSFYSGSDPGYPGSTLSLKYHLTGSNMAAPIVFPNVDVDVNVEINFWKTEKNNEIGVNGNIVGDRFPANENYLVDEKNNKLFLGVSGVNSENGDNGPYTELPGDNKRDMSSFNFTILFNDDKSFKGVRTPGGREYSIADWNKMFSDLNPKSSKTGTTVGSSMHKEDDFKGATNQ